MTTRRLHYISVGIAAVAMLSTTTSAQIVETISGEYDVSQEISWPGYAPVSMHLQNAVTAANGADILEENNSFTNAIILPDGSVCTTYPSCSPPPDCLLFVSIVASLETEHVGASNFRFSGSGTFTDLVNINCHPPGTHNMSAFVEIRFKINEPIVTDVSLHNNDPSGFNAETAQRTISLRGPVDDRFPQLSAAFDETWNNNSNLEFTTQLFPGTYIFTHTFTGSSTAAHFGSNTTSGVNLPGPSQLLNIQSTAPPPCGTGERCADIDLDGIITASDLFQWLALPIDTDGDSIIDPDPYGLDASWIAMLVNAVGATGPDCNDNGFPDAYDIATGFSLDIDADTIPDECPLCVGDIDADIDTDVLDFAAFTTAFGSSTGDPEYNADADLNDDGDIDIFDFGLFAADFGCGT